MNKSELCGYAASGEAALGSSIKSNFWRRRTTGMI
jgi:hypothetical protein